MASSATWVPDAPKRAVPSIRGRYSLDVLRSRFLGTGPALALIVLELAVFTASGCLIEPFNISGNDGLGVEQAEDVPVPQVLVPAMPQPRDQRSRRTLATSPVGWRPEAVAHPFPFRGGPSANPAGKRPEISLAVVATAKSTRPTAQVVGSSLHSLKAAVALSTDAPASPVRVADSGSSQGRGRGKARSTGLEDPAQTHASPQAQPALESRSARAAMARQSGPKPGRRAQRGLVGRKEISLRHAWLPEARR